jgi:hypothetical protein
MSERTTHDPLTQSITTRFSTEYRMADEVNSLAPVPFYYGTDFTGEEIGPFFTLGAVEWCLACRANVRDSKAYREGTLRA